MLSEMEKDRAYNARFMAVEHATFTPLVFTIKGVGKRVLDLP